MSLHHVHAGADDERAASVKYFAELYGVCDADIHSLDFIYSYHLNNNKGATQADAVAIYFKDGARSAKLLYQLIDRFLPESIRHRHILEFASGYGCVTRHLAQNPLNLSVTSSEIHPAAIDFIRDKIGVRCFLSRSSPEAFSELDEEQYGVVFALSFFSHMPPPTWARWARVLLSKVAPGGILIFTALGRYGARQIGVDIGAEGWWFAPVSEQHDLDPAEYGTMLVRPEYVNAAFEGTKARPVFFEEGHWWGYQDTYVFQNDGEPPTARTPEDILDRAAALNPPPVISKLEHEKVEALGSLAAIRASTTWRLGAPIRGLKLLMKRTRN